MTESEAIKELKQNIEMPFGSNISNEVSKLAIKALEEIQQYRVIGTVEECSKLKEYEEIGTPNEIRAKLCFLTTYKRADSDGRLLLILDKNGYCEELGGLHIDEIRKRCLEREEKKMTGKEVIESLDNAWRALTRQYDKNPDEGTRCGMNLLAKIIGIIKTEVEESNKEKQITIEEWITILQKESK